MNLCIIIPTNQLLLCCYSVCHAMDQCSQCSCAASWRAQSQPKSQRPKEPAKEPKNQRTKEAKDPKEPKNQRTKEPKNQRTKETKETKKQRNQRSQRTKEPNNAGLMLLTLLREGEVAKTEMVKGRQACSHERKGP